MVAKIEITLTSTNHTDVIIWGILPWITFSSAHQKEQNQNIHHSINLSQRTCHQSVCWLLPVPQVIQIWFQWEFQFFIQVIYLMIIFHQKK